MKTTASIVSRCLFAAAWVGWAASCAPHGETANGRGTRDPGRLEHYRLAEEVDVRGLGVNAALAKLDAAYRETCRRTGETPLKLNFEVPPGHESPLDLRLSSRTLDQSVRRVGAAAKLEVQRRGTAYRFKAPRETGQVVRKTLRVPPDLLSRLAGPDRAARSSPRAAFRAFGVDLEESTRLTFKGSSALLEVETRSAGDLAAIDGVIESVIGEMPMQQKLQPRVFEVAAGSDWKAPREDWLDARAADRVFAGLSKRKDVKAESLPVFTQRVGEESTVRMNGGVLRVKTGLMGTGHELSTDFSGSAVIRDRGYVGDDGTRLTVTTRPDGSRVVLAVTPTWIDAAGRPVHRHDR